MEELNASGTIPNGKTADSGAAFLVERNADMNARTLESQWLGVITETAEHILAVKFEEGSEHVTKNESAIEQLQLISARDIEQPDIEERDRELVREMLT